MLLTRKRIAAVHHRAAPGAALPSGRIGRVHSVSPEGEVLVVCEGVLESAVAAAVAAPWPGSPDGLRGRSVVLVFENGDPHRPIVIGWVQYPAEARSARVDGRTVVIEAEREIELKCGDASLTLTADGRVLIRGRGVLSHARELNRIRGGQVKIN